MATRKISLADKVHLNRVYGAMTVSKEKVDREYARAYRNLQLSPKELGDLAKVLAQRVSVTGMPATPVMVLDCASSAMHFVDRIRERVIGEVNAKLWPKPSKRDVARIKKRLGISK